MPLPVMQSRTLILGLSSEIGWYKLPNKHLENKPPFSYIQIERESKIESIGVSIEKSVGTLAGKFHPL
jgi:hypothetical protein